MTAALSICALGLLSALLLAALLLREHRHDAERAALLDRITAPKAAEYASAQRLAPATPPTLDTDAADDLRFGVDLTYDEDLEMALEREL